MHDHDTGFHDHDLSDGAVGVVAGAVREDRLVLGGGTVSREVAAGGTFTFSAPTSTACCTPARRRPSPSTRTPRRCGGWAPTRSLETGELRRHSVSYAEELRPAHARRSRAS